MCQAAPPRCCQPSPDSSDVVDLKRQRNEDCGQLGSARMKQVTRCRLQNCSLNTAVGASTCFFRRLEIYFQLYLLLPVLRRLESHSRSGELRTQKLRSHLLRTQSLEVLPLKPGVGQYIAMHAALTARDFFLAYFYPSCPFTCIFSKTSPDFFLCWPAE